VLAHFDVFIGPQAYGALLTFLLGYPMVCGVAAYMLDPPYFLTFFCSYDIRMLGSLLSVIFEPPSYLIRTPVTLIRFVSYYMLGLISLLSFALYLPIYDLANEYFSLSVFIFRLYDLSVRFVQVYLYWCLVNLTL